MKKTIKLIAIISIIASDSRCSAPVTTNYIEYPAVQYNELVDITTSTNGMNYPTGRQMFQPSDGSMTNGTYNMKNHTAQTALHSYDNVMVVYGNQPSPSSNSQGYNNVILLNEDGNPPPPILNAQGKYIDKKGNKLDPIGSFTASNDDYANYDTYYLFGNLSQTQTKMAQTKMAQTKNVPIETYSSTSE